MRKLLIPAFLLTASAAIGQIPTSGLVAFYPFQGTTLDSSGSGNHAVAAGGGYVEDRFGNAASAYHLEGAAGDSIVMDIPGYTPLTGDFSMSLWLRLPDCEVAQVLSLAQYADDTTDNFEFRLNYHSIRQTVLEIQYGSNTYWNGAGYDVNKGSESGGCEYADGQWKHFVIRRRNDTLQLWNRHFPLWEQVYAGPIGDALPLVVGGSPHRFTGEVDDVAFYNRAVSDQEIRRLLHDHQPYDFASPLGTDAYVLGDTAVVMVWADTTLVSDSIDLDYSLDGGITWTPTGHPQTIDYFPFRFPLPFPAGTGIELRVRDHLNTSVEQRTGTFVMSEYKWTEVNPSLPFTARDGSGLLNFAGKMWLIGGWDPPHHAATNYTHSQVWTSLDGITWDSLPDAPWVGRHCSGWLVHDSALWVIGGDPQSNSLRDVWRSTDGLTWTQLHDTIPGVWPARNMHNVASLGGNILYYGGQPAPAYVPENLSEVWQSPDGIAWTQLPDAPWKGRGMMLNQCIDDAGNLWMLGGGRLNDRRCFNDVWRTADGVTWEKVMQNAPWDPRYWHSVAYFDSKLWIMAGSVHQTDGNEVWYSVDGLDWHELKNSPFGIRHAHSTTVYNDALWLMAGINSNNAWKLVNTLVQVEDPQADASGLQWHPNPTTGWAQASEGFESLQVMDAQGRLVLMQGAGQAVDLGALAPGLYHLVAETQQGVVARKVVVQ